MPNSQPSPLFGEICACIEGISARSPQERERYARDIAEISGRLRPLERLAALNALERMVEKGESDSDFVFGIYAYGEAASGSLPSFSEGQKPPSHSDTVATVIRLCGLGRAEKSRGREKVLRAGTRAIQSIMQGKNPNSAAAPIREAICSGSCTQKILALRASQVIDLQDESVMLAAAKAMLGEDHSVCIAAEEAFRKITRYGHPLRGILLESRDAYIRRAVAGHLQASPESDISFLSRIAILGFFSGNLKARAIVSELAEHGFLRQKEIDEVCRECFHASPGKLRELDMMASGARIPNWGQETLPGLRCHGGAPSRKRTFPLPRGKEPVHTAYRLFNPSKFPIKA